MGTKVQAKSYLPGYYSMRDLNEDSNSCTWPFYYGDRTLTNGQYYSGVLQRASTGSYPGYDKDAVKQKMLEHEAIFKNQVYELHRLYRIQKELMDEIRGKDLCRNQVPTGTLLSSSPLASQMTPEDARKWHGHHFPFANSFCARAPVPGAENISPPLNSIKVNGSQTGRYLSKNGGSSKDLEVLESRPTKVRRKIIDLRLPADEYIDIEEGDQLSDDKLRTISSKFLDSNRRNTPQSETKFFLGDAKNSGCKTKAVVSDTCSRSINVLADLNEPAQFEETKERNPSAYKDLNSCNGKTQVSNLSAKPNSQLPSLTKETSLSSHNGCNNSTQNKVFMENNGGARGWFSHVFEAGQSRSNLNTAARSFQPEKLPIQVQSTQFSLSELHEPSTYLNDRNNVVLWKDGTLSSGVEIFERTHDFANSKHLGSISASYASSPCAKPTTSDFSKSLSHSVSLWENPTGSLSQKSVSIHTQPGFNSTATSSKSYQTSGQSNGIFGDRWYLNCGARSNSVYGNEMQNRNGFYHGSSSVSKELAVCFPPVGNDHMSCSNENNRVPEHLVSHGSAKYCKDSTSSDLNPAKVMNLNMSFSNKLSKQEIPVLDLESIGREQKHEDHIAVLPWLRSKPVCKNEAANMEIHSKNTEMTIVEFSGNQPSNKSEITKDPGQLLSSNIKPASSANDPEVRIEPCHFQINKKLLGFPIFEKPDLSKSKSSSRGSPVSPLHSSESKPEDSRSRLLDINLPCGPSFPDMVSVDATDLEVVEKGKKARNVSFRHCIDLNSHLSDDEASLKPSSPNTSVRNTIEIDLEVPIVHETDDDDMIAGEASLVKQNETPLASPREESGLQQDELMLKAAEAIVAISLFGCDSLMDQTTCNPPVTLSKESSLVDPLTWFVEIVSSCADDFESRFDTVVIGKNGEDNQEHSSEGSDSFESMTLKLTETKEEDYIPKPFIPDNLKFEETGATLLSNRPRRGSAKRGRQRRDFQRDILPGLVSLSRHEVTEDLQTFGELMQATGHSWHSRLARRKSTNRGRRRSVVTQSPPMATSPASTSLMQQLNNLEVGLDDKSLTGWGKTTRRPRRQRYPAGNHVSIPLT